MEFDAVDPALVHGLFELVSPGSFGEEQQARFGVRGPQLLERVDEHVSALPFGHGAGVDEVGSVRPVIRQVPVG